MSDYRLSMVLLEKEEEARCALKVWLHYVYEDCKQPMSAGDEDPYYTEKKKKIRDLIEYIDDN